MRDRPRSRGHAVTGVLALVAAHDEEEAIGPTVKRLLAVPGVGEVVVVADGCSDRTAEEAAGSGAHVLVCPRRLGKGGALEGALDRLHKADAYLLVDGDTGDTAGEAAALVEAIDPGRDGARLELAVGVLPPQAGGGFGLVRLTSAALIRALTGFEAAAPLSGQRAMTRDALWACRPLAEGFGVETAMTIDAVRLGFRVGEVPVRMRHRPTGRSVQGFAHRGRQALDILRAALPRALGLR
jgi:glycosyltransferase involved in cell wall biosynthesis